MPDQYRLWVGQDFFETMGIPLLQGRDFGSQDEMPTLSKGNRHAIEKTGRAGTPDAPLLAVINQEMAQRYE